MIGEEESKHKRFPIDEEAIAEVVSMMTGIPVKRMVQAETENCAEWLLI
jgi:ATP-dependent Clp protease ATP-binding subunit ClpC